MLTSHIYKCNVYSLDQFKVSIIKLMNTLLSFLLLFPFVSAGATTSSPILLVTPQTVIQGEPAMVTVENISLAEINRITFDGKPINFFLYKTKPTAFIPIDLKHKAGNYKIEAELFNGKILSKTLTVNERPKLEASLGIPEKLGGNTPQAQKQVVSSLSQENAKLNSLYTGKKSFWTEKFRFPLATQVITDPYGYSRLTGSYVISHKGTDFRAKEGTRVNAMNRGVVRFARETKVYGKTVVVDHGLGLMTFYMHLSKINVNEGELVLPGQLIGLSGKTGYAEAPHLHVSVRINNVSIDPMKFMEFFM